MNPPTKAGKRIVSKDAYVKAQANRAFDWLAVAVFMGLGIRMLAFAWSIWHQVGVGVCLLLLVIIVSFFYTAWDTLQRARTIDPGVPLTHANTADLPAPESLVRASEQPSAALETVLVRASVQGPETPPEQLVRAAGAYE